MWYLYFDFCQLFNICNVHIFEAQLQDYSPNVGTDVEANETRGWKKTSLSKKSPSGILLISDLKFNFFLFCQIPLYYVIQVLLFKYTMYL